MGINASRKINSRLKGNYSFEDDTPRAATQEEIERQFGPDSDEVKKNLISFCKLKGETGNISTGFGLWPKDKEPKGTDKGNTKRNMCNIRAERQATDRLPGQAIPQNVEVMDEKYIEGEVVEIDGVGQVKTVTGEILSVGDDETPPTVATTTAPEPEDIFGEKPEDEDSRDHTKLTSDQLKELSLLAADNKMFGADLKAWCNQPDRDWRIVTSPTLEVWQYEQIKLAAKNGNLKKVEV